MSRTCPPSAEPTEPRRLDDWVAEVVAVVLGDLAEGHANPDVETSCARMVLLVDALLDAAAARWLKSGS